QAAPIPLRLFAQLHLRVILEPRQEDVVEALMKPPSILHPHRCCIAVNVVLKMSTQQARTIPRRPALTRLQEKARALNSPETKHISLRLKKHVLPTERPRAYSRHMLAFHLEPNRIGMQPDCNPLAFERRAVQNSKVRLRAPPRKIRNQRVILRLSQPQPAPHIAILSCDRSQSLQLQRALI